MQARSRFVKLFGQFIFAAQFVFFRQAWIFVHFRKGGSQIRQHEIFRMAGGDDFPAFFHQVGVVGFFIHGEEHFLLQLVEFLLAGILVKGQFIFFHDAAQLGILHGAQEGAVAGLAHFYFEQAAAHFFRAAFFLGFQGLGHQFVAKVRLGLHHAFNGGAQGIVRVRIVCAFIDDIYMISDLITQQDDIKVIEIKDYIKNPKSNGYRSYHMIVEIPVFFAKGKTPMRVELQIRTNGMDFWATLEHQLRYKKGIEEMPGYDEISEELLHSARAIIEADNEMQRIKDKIGKIGRAHV